eukprot:1203195-Rhodomonas_salina.1
MLQVDGDSTEVAIRRLGHKLMKRILVQLRQTYSTLCESTRQSTAVAQAERVADLAPRSIRAAQLLIHSERLSAAYPWRDGIAPPGIKIYVRSLRMRPGRGVPTAVQHRAAYGALPSLLSALPSSNNSTAEPK